MTGVIGTTGVSASAAVGALTSARVRRIANLLRTRTTALVRTSLFRLSRKSGEFARR